MHYLLESTDTAGRVPHPSPTRPDVGRDVRHGCQRVGAASEFFFLEFVPTLLDLHQHDMIRAELALIRVEPG